MHRDEPLDELHRQAVLRLVQERGPAPVVLAACDVLVAGHDGEHLRALAAVSVSERAVMSGFELDGLVREALRELGRSFPQRGTDEAAVAYARALAVDVLRGALPPREFTAWIHLDVGHGGAPVLQPLVELDDCYDTHYSDDLDAEVLVRCRELTDPAP